jgi:hypothetical protein
MAGYHEERLREVYADEDTTGNVWFAHALADAREQDRIAAIWAEKADAEQLDGGDGDDESELEQ